MCHRRRPSTEDPTVSTSRTPTSAPTDTQQAVPGACTCGQASPAEASGTRKRAGSASRRTFERPATLVQPLLMPAGRHVSFPSGTPVRGPAPRRGRARAAQDRLEQDRLDPVARNWRLAHQVPQDWGQQDCLVQDCRAPRPEPRVGRCWSPLACQTAGLLMLPLCPAWPTHPATAWRSRPRWTPCWRPWWRGCRRRSQWKREGCVTYLSLMGVPRMRPGRRWRSCAARRE